MKIFKYLFFSAVLMVGMSSCYDEEYFLDENTTSDGRHFPVIQTVSPEGNFNEGETINLVMQYWSQDPVDKHELYATVGSGSETLYSTTEYVYGYDSETGGEVVSLPYVIPAGASGQSISFRIIVINENELFRQKTTSIDVN
jgi:hypothetical protein